MADDFHPWTDDEFDEDAFLESWAEADRQAAAVLREECADVLRTPAPARDLERAASQLRDGLRRRGHAPTYEYVRRACGWSGVPDLDDTDLWLIAVASTISPREDPGVPSEDESVLMALEHADWFGLVAGLERRGVGAELDAGLVAHDIDELTDGDAPCDEGDKGVLEHALLVLAPLWVGLGVLDTHKRLTPLGRWGLPRALLRVWEGGNAGPLPELDPSDDLDAEARQKVVGLLAQRPRTVEELRRELAKQSVFVDADRLERALGWPIEGYEFHDGVWGHLPTIAEGLVVTHPVSEEEIGLGVLAADFDLAPFIHLADEPLPYAGGGDLRARYAASDLPMPTDSGVALLGPDDWLAGIGPGNLVALRYAGGQVTLEQMESDPSHDADVAAALVHAAREAARRNEEDPESDGPGVAVSDVVWDLLRDHPEALRAPRPPISEMLAESELEVDRGYVGLPGTDWEEAPDFLPEKDQETYREWSRATRSLGRDEQVPEGDLRGLAAGLHGLLLDLIAVQVTDHPGLGPLLERIVEAADETTVAGPLYLRARAAEGRGDVEAWIAALEAVLRADPTHREGAGDLADLRALTGDAHEALRLYRVAAVDEQGPELRALRPLLSPPEGEVGRNKPCACGSGKKYKLCHGRTDRHPLSTRSPWLWSKVVGFAQRGARRRNMLEWASLFSGEAPDSRRTVLTALGDGFVHDTAIFDGGMLDEFLDVVGSLLPEDEHGLATGWATTPRRLVEVTRVLPMRGVQGRDLLTEEELEVRDRQITTQVQAKDLLYGRPLDDGSGVLRFFSDPLMVPRMLRGRLLDLLRSDAPVVDIVGLLRSGGAPSELRNTEGHQLVDCTARYDVADPERLWSVLAAQHEADGQQIMVGMPAAGGGMTIRGTFTRDGDRFAVRTNSLERLRDLQAIFLVADPDARLVDESTRPIELPTDLPRQPSSPSQSPPTDLPPDLVEQVIRGQEEQWLSNPVPALAGRTPREAAADPELRGDLEALLDDFEWTDRRSPLALTMDVARLRETLGLR